MKNTNYCEKSCANAASFSNMLKLCWNTSCSILGMRSFRLCVRDLNWIPVDHSAHPIPERTIAFLCFRCFLIPIYLLPSFLFAVQTRNFSKCGLGPFLGRLTLTRQQFYIWNCWLLHNSLCYRITFRHASTTSKPPLLGLGKFTFKACCVLRESNGQARAKKYSACQIANA